ncbi:hypothetical protein QAD02_017794 [Eretmocerus hayati]|uniref:Uncharacterized protein n=1 Tax=Eretmocerus hayati TaxID=131215 RepID=A0ACC2PHV6_9HYME|nr:hypothetical protein QAD02_017794 [Eretmocerus hayati]
MHECKNVQFDGLHLLEPFTLSQHRTKRVRITCSILETGGAAGINITMVDIPYLIKAGSPEPIVLDCNYELGSSSATGLVIKWFVNADPLYQWIHGKTPVGSEEFRKYIDVSFKASNDPKTMFRAVKLVKPGHELSGDVKCSIETMFDEVQASRRMLVYSPEKSLQIYQPSLNETTNRLTVICIAEDLYPRPRIVLYRDRRLIDRQEQKFRTKEDGRFDAEAVAFLKADRILLPTVFRCEVTIPEANYTSVREYIYNGSHTSHLSLLLLTINYFVVRRYQ